MTRDDIIRTAREAGFSEYHLRVLDQGIYRLADLVAAAERERIKWDGIHSCHSECDKPVCVAIRKAVEAEREACAKVVEEWLHGEWHNQGVVATTMIRARGQV